MTQLLDTLETRIVAMMESAYDGTGAATGRAITAGVFRRSAQNAPLRDPSYPIGDMDRAYELEYLSISDEPDAPTNPFDGVSLRTIVLALNIGYVYGVNAANQVSKTGSEDKAVSVLHARKRALSDAETVYRAMGYGPIFSGSLTGGITWCECVRDGATTVNDLTGGRLLSVTRYRIVIEITNTTAYTP